MEALSLTQYYYKIEKCKIFIKMMKILIYDRRISKKYHKLEKIQIKHKFKLQHLMKFSHFLKGFLYKNPLKHKFNKIRNFQKYNYQISKEAGNQPRQKHLALKAERYKCKNKIKKKFSKAGIHKKL
jgi:hypothetical protein